MRKIATIRKVGSNAVRIMLYDSRRSGVYLFVYESQEDGPCTEDYWFDSGELAEKSALEVYGVSTPDWQKIPEPSDGCQHDWIAPTRVRRDNAGKPIWGQFERV